jgi:hypothetical protein
MSEGVESSSISGFTSETISRDEMRAELARRVDEAGGVRAFSRKHSLSHSSVSMAINRARPVTEELANACGFFAVTRFGRKI